MELTVTLREQLGKSAARAARRAGLVLAEVYGHGEKNMHVAAEKKAFAKIFRAAGETSVITLKAGDQNVPVMIHDIARDPRTGEIAHADFYRVKMNEKMTVAVPLEFVGESPAVKNGGVLVKAMQAVEVEALPADMPHALTVDLAQLIEIGSSLHVKDIPAAELKGKAVIITDAEAVIASVTEQRAEEEAAAPAMTMEDVKVETEEQKAAREKEKAETAAKE
jgi:large subunit ribosomal protein L25